MFRSFINGINKILGRAHEKQANYQCQSNDNNNSKFELCEVNNSTSSSVDNISLSDYFHPPTSANEMQAADDNAISLLLCHKDKILQGDFSQNIERQTSMEMTKPTCDNCNSEEKSLMKVVVDVEAEKRQISGTEKDACTFKPVAGNDGCGIVESAGVGDSDLKQKIVKNCDQSSEVHVRDGTQSRPKDGCDVKNCVATLVDAGRKDGDAPKERETGADDKSKEGMHTEEIPGDADKGKNWSDTHGKDRKKNRRGRGRGNWDRKSRSDNTNWRQRDAEPSNEEAQDPNEKEPEDFVEMVKWKTERKYLHDAKKLVYGLGFVKDMTSGDLQALLVGQYKIAEEKKRNDWVKNVRYFAEVVVDTSWIDKNLPPLGQASYVPRHLRPEWREKRQGKENKKQNVVTDDGGMCRDIRLKSDPTICVVRENAANTNTVSDIQKEDKICLPSLGTEKGNSRIAGVNSHDTGCETDKGIDNSEGEKNQEGKDPESNIIETQIHVDTETVTLEPVIVVSQSTDDKPTITSTKAMEVSSSVENWEKLQLLENSEASVKSKCTVERVSNSQSESDLCRDVQDKEAVCDATLCPNKSEGESDRNCNTSGDCHRDGNASHKLGDRDLNILNNSTCLSNELSLGAMETVSSENDACVCTETIEEIDPSPVTTKLQSEFSDPAILSMVKTEEELKKYPSLQDRMSPDHDYLLQYDGIIYESECTGEWQQNPPQDLLGLIMSGKGKEDSGSETPYTVEEGSVSDISEMEHHYDSQSPDEDGDSHRLCHHIRYKSQSPDRRCDVPVSHISGKDLDPVCTAHQGNSSSGMFGLSVAGPVGQIWKASKGKMLSDEYEDLGSPLLCGEDVCMADKAVETEEHGPLVEDVSCDSNTRGSNREEEVVIPNVNTLTEMVQAQISAIDLDAWPGENTTSDTDRQQANVDNVEDYVSHGILGELAERISDD